jgi:DNA-directed RNA polymerase subunit L
MLEREFRSLEIYRCFKMDADGEPYSYDFTVETVGCMSVDKIVLDALNAVATLCDKYAALDSGDLPENVDIRPADARMKGFDVWFQAEDHTLGNLLQTLITEIYLDTEAPDSPITYVGYKVRHPLHRVMTLRLGFRNGVTADPAVIARQVIATAAQKAKQILDDLGRSWASVGTADAGAAAPALEGGG